MNKYEIHPVEGDTPYAAMHGDFSMDDLMVILDEMREVYQAPYVWDVDDRNRIDTPSQCNK